MDDSISHDALEEEEKSVKIGEENQKKSSTTLSFESRLALEEDPARALEILVFRRERDEINDSQLNSLVKTVAERRREMAAQFRAKAREERAQQEAIQNQIERREKIKKQVQDAYEAELLPAKAQGEYRSPTFEEFEQAHNQLQRLAKENYQRVQMERLREIAEHQKQL